MRSPLFFAAAVSFAFAPGLLGCGGFAGPRTPTRAPLAEQWYSRAQASYKSGDFEEAHDSVAHALAAAPQDAEVRILAARIALTRLEFSDALKFTDGLKLEGAPAAQLHGVRGRAYWYSGDVDQAADELEAMLSDPEVKDPWARDVANLARRGSGRHPFSMVGGIVAPTALLPGIDRVPFGPADVVQIELEGDPVLALVATGVSEVMIDSNARRDPAWVNLRFGGQIEVNDVPALTQDLSPISRQLGVPIKALLGANLLRHIHCTFDRHGEQFVVRKQDAAPPPDANRVPIWYLRGGGMTLHGLFSNSDKSETPLFVDSSRFFLLELADPTWKHAGIDPATLKPFADAPNIRRGVVPNFKMGGFDLPKMPATEGDDLGEFQAAQDVDVGGVVGAELLAYFRVTFADEGRFVWLEPDPTLLAAPSRPPPPPMQPDADAPPPAVPPSPARGGSASPPASVVPNGAPANRTPSKPAAGR